MEVPAIARKVLVATATGGITFLATNITNQPAFPAAVLSLLTGSVALLVQFLADLERRQLAVESGLGSLESGYAAESRRIQAVLSAEVAKIDDARALYRRLDQTSSGLSLVTRLAQLLPVAGDRPPNLAIRVAESEVSAAVDLLDALTRTGQAVTEGEDRDWLTALTRLSNRSLDAVSLCSEGPGGAFSDDGFWSTEIGAYYLELQREAVRRDVRLRRLFIVPNAKIARHPELVDLVRQHQAVGIDTRVLQAVKLAPSRRHLIPDIVIFDGEVSYQLVAAPRLDPKAPRYFTSTRMSVDPREVSAHLALFADFWEAGETTGTEWIESIAEGDGLRTADPG